MLALTLLVVSIAIADSINPSTIVPALWLAGASKGRSLASFTLGVFAVYLVGGMVLVFGPGRELIRALRHISGPVEGALEVAGGAVAVAFAITVWRSRHHERGDRRPPSHPGAGAFLLGAGIMAVELPTALLYFGAISAILASHSTGATEVLLLVAYNVLFIAPLLGLLAVRRVATKHADRWLAFCDQWLRQVGQLALACAAGVAGAVFVALGVSGLITS